MMPDGLDISSNGDTYTLDSASVGDDKLYRKDGRGVKFYTPDTQIDKTRGYNEMDYYFIQGGKKIQPDYIMAFRKNGKIDNIEQVVQGAKGWGGELPIVIVDVDRCLAAERGKVDNMLMQYNQQKTPQLAREILQKVRNNRQTDNSFGEDIPVKDIEEWLEEQGLQEILEDNDVRTNNQAGTQGKVTMSDLEVNNRKVSAQERKEGISAMRKLRDKLQEMVSKREGEDIEQ